MIRAPARRRRPPSRDADRPPDGPAVAPVTRLQHLLHARATLGPAVVLAVAIVVFASVSDRFLQPTNVSLVLQQVAVVGTLAVGQTIIILTAGIDLSVGAIMVLSSIVMGEAVGRGRTAGAGGDRQSGSPWAWPAA